MSVLSGCLLGPATGFAGLLIILTSPVEVNWSSTSVNLCIAWTHCLMMQCLVPPLWQDMEAVAWLALWLHTLQPCSTLCCSWCFLLAIWWTVWLPLRHTHSETHSEVRPACTLSHWRILTSVSILKSLLDAWSPALELLSPRRSNWLEGCWLQLMCCPLPKRLCP